MPSDANIGSGPDAVVLKVSQDAFQGDARYTVSIDGVQADGTLTAGALHSLGEQDTVTVLGNFTPGQHTVTVDFLNDAWGGTPETDRNLYVESVSFEGQILPDSTVALLTAGPRTVGTFLEATSTGRGFGSGPDTLTLRISQDDWLGNAQYTISVDGVQIGDALTASAERQFGQYDTVWVSRDFGAGQHTVTVDFLNDAWGGTPETDRNLYVEGVSLNRDILPNSTAAFFSGGALAVATFSVAPPPSPLDPVGTDGPDRLQESPGQGDVFWGGPGADAFAFGVGVAMNPHSPGEFFTTVLGTGVGSGARDVILDFRQGEDVIDLSAALQFGRRALFVDDVFRFIGSAEFSGTPEGGGTAPPELRYEVRGGRTIIQTDGSGVSQFRGDGRVDAEIELVGVFSLESGHFIL
jgi:hypothetical protein